MPRRNRRVRVNWESLDWKILDRLRDNFLSGAAADGPYWHTLTDLACYDFTFGQRIGWKWDAVLRELKLRDWTPPTGATVLDWGCGSGIAGRRVVEFFGAANFSRLLVHDRSALAMDFAEHQGRTVFPQLAVERASHRFLQGNEQVDVLVASHVLNELHGPDLAGLLALMARARTILWVEPGNHEVSRVLGSWRKKLLSAGLQAVAPCPHQAACGVLAAGHDRHWCHFFATPPAGIYADSGWVKFGQRAGIDLRSLPYSFLVLDRREPAAPAGLSRIIGEPRFYKGYAKIFSCDAGGVQELMVQKRDAPALLKALKYAVAPTLHRWTHAGGRITKIEPL
ncbi:MAG: hypothetical protein EXS42_03115 [Lacunisphaera sp.]|nr:hypothetical protein [Lacunisphaera sp.]